MKTCESQLDLWEFISFENCKKNPNCWFTAKGENLSDRFLSQLEHLRNPRVVFFYLSSTHQSGIPECCTPKFALPFFTEDTTLGFLRYSSWLRNRSDRFSPVAVNQQLGFFLQFSKEMNSQGSNWLSHVFMLFQVYWKVNVCSQGMFVWDKRWNLRLSFGTFMFCLIQVNQIICVF